MREEYQGQGYMRKALELAFAEGNRLGLPVVLDTDAKLKSDKYRHLGMELAGVRTCKTAVNYTNWGVSQSLCKPPN